VPAFRVNLGANDLNCVGVPLNATHSLTLRIGHTRFMNSYLLKGENQPECEACQSPLTVKHILIDCTHLSAVRQRYFRVDTLKELFEIVDS